MTHLDTTKQNTTVAGQNSADRDYWLEKLAGEWRKSSFPYDRQPRDDRGSIPDNMKTVSFRFEGESFKVLSKLSNNSDYRLFMVLLSQVILLLNKYTGSKDIIVGAPIVKQETEGDYINTVLPLRQSIDAQHTLKQLLIAVRQTLTEAVEHQNYPMETLLHKLEVSSFFDVAVLLENIHHRAYLDRMPSNMVIGFRLEPDSVSASIRYNPAFYNNQSIQAISRHFSYLIERITNNLDLPIHEISILSGVETRQLEDFNDTWKLSSGEAFGGEASGGVASPEVQLIHRLFEQQVLKTPDNIAVVDPLISQNAEPASYTYKELNEEANQVAWMLKERGVGPDKPVALMMDPSVQRVSSILGILKAGGSYLPMDPEFPAQRVSGILADSNISTLLTDQHVLSRRPYTMLSRMAANSVSPIRTAPRKQLSDMDLLPLPDRTLVDYSKYHQYIGEAMVKHKVLLQTTRGCPYGCTYCHKIWPKTQIRRSADSIFQEIQYCYNAGMRKFALIDDIFNLDMENGRRLFRMILKNKMDLQIFFCNGLRADILTEEYIDLMIEAGTVNMDVSLESASPRIQRLIKKNLNIDKFYENIDYITKTYPQVILEMEIMLGFPTETEEEAMMTLDFLKNIQWVHYPNMHILKVYPNSDMAKTAMEHGVSEEAINRSTKLAFHELPETLPFPKSFVLEFQSRFMNEYFLSKERLKQVLPIQTKLISEGAIIDKYDSYLPVEIKKFTDILDFAGLTMDDIGNPEMLPKGHMEVPDFNERIKEYFPAQKKDPDALKILMLDLSQFFTSEKEKMIHNQNDEPLGFMYLLTYLNKTFGARVTGKIYKTGIDFDGYSQLEEILADYKPDIIAIRTLTYYSEFFHEFVSFIRQIGVTEPIISGGPYATSDYRFILQDSGLDAIAFGEGELTLAEIIRHMLDNNKKFPSDEVLETINGIAFVKKEQRDILRQKALDVIPVDRMKSQISAYSKENPENVNQPQDLLYMITTSGSTGKPKSTMLEHRNLANLIHFQYEQTEIDFSGNVLQFASIGFDVSAQEIFSTLLEGGTLHLVDTDMKTDVGDLFHKLEKDKIDILFIPPSFLKMVFSEVHYAGLFPKNVKHIIAAGEQLIVPPALKEHMKANQVFLHNHYGPSETHVVTTLTIDPNGEIPDAPNIGRPIANTSIHILDEHGMPMPVGVAGELIIAGANVGRGYYNNKELTDKSFSVSDEKRFYKTGDLARWLSDGTIQFLGRKDHQVKIRGFRIELGEIESHLKAVTGIKDAVVIDRAVGKSGDRQLCAYYVPEGEESGKRVASGTYIIDRLSDNLPDYMMPSFFIRLVSIPLTSSGKLDRKCLPDPEADKDDYVAPRNDMEMKLTEIWSEILEQEQSGIGIDDSFFELGGHSLKATILISRIHKTFNVKAGLGEMFDNPTIRGLAQYIRVHAKEAFTAISKADKKEYYPLSSAQKRLYVHHQMKADNITYNMSGFMQLEGLLDQDRFQQVFQQLVQRHESFRTGFVMIDDLPMQKIHPGVTFEIQQFTADRHAVDSVIGQFVRPFDLSVPPLLRVGLIQTGAERFILMVDMHHIISDGTSLKIFMREFMALYRQEQLTDLPVSYKDFSEWQNRLMTSHEFVKQEEYWMNQFSGDIPVLEMPTDYPRSELQDFKGAEVFIEAGKQLTEQVKALVLESDTTLHIFLLSAFSILLSKYSGQEDIVVGSAVAGRRHADLESVVGLFINMLPLRNRVRETSTFMELLAKVRETALNGYANQDYQYEQLVAKLDLQGKPGRNPLIDFVFTMQNVDIKTLELQDLKITPYETDTTDTRFDLAVDAFDHEDKLSFTFNYSTGLYRRSTMEKMAGRLLEILEQVVQIPEIQLKEITLSGELKDVTFDTSKEKEESFDF